MTRRAITPADILPMEAYGAIRTATRQALIARKRLRRLAVGPDATVLFECYDTVWQQVQEMLFVERGGAAQIADELAAYNPLVPRGDELVATLMVEIDDPVRRADLLGRLGGVEATLTLDVGGGIVHGVPETDPDRHESGAKASSVQFVRFPFTSDMMERFRTAGTRIVLGIGHPAYRHMTVVPEAMRRELAADFA